jgi:regulator of replication initiation timing
LWGFVLSFAIMLSINVESTESEILYKIRALTQNIGMQGDMLADLRDNIKKCVKENPKDEQLKKCLFILDEMTAITESTNKNMKKLQKSYKRYSSSKA